MVIDPQVTGFSPLDASIPVALIVHLVTPRPQTHFTWGGETTEGAVVSCLA